MQRTQTLAALNVDPIEYKLRTWVIKGIAVVSFSCFECVHSVFDQELDVARVKSQHEQMH